MRGGSTGEVAARLGAAAVANPPGFSPHPPQATFKGLIQSDTTCSAALEERISNGVSLLLSAQLVARSLGRPMKDIVRLSTSKFGGAMATVPLGIFAGADSDGDGLTNWKDSDVMDFDGCVHQPTALQTFCTAPKKN